MPWKLASLLARGRQIDNPPTQEPLQELWLFLKAVCSNRGGQTNYQGNEKYSEKKKKKREFEKEGSREGKHCGEGFQLLG